MELSRGSYWEGKLNECKCQMKSALIPDGLGQFVLYFLPQLTLSCLLSRRALWPCCRADSPVAVHAKGFGSRCV